MTSPGRTSEPRSWAWALGWLSLSGPVLLVTGNAPSLIGTPLVPWASILLDLWAVVSVFFGVAAVAFARDDAESAPDDRPRFVTAGMALGLLGLAVSGCLLLLWLLTPLPF
ncbi:hypothetical protein [Frigoribacterium sp. ME-P-080]|uniref:hypothetical protein n=1 Tax=Frigoribacterium sp. ME-P-080 TaxID=3040289 RepID=UPI00254D8344|nr:hypothetical protein [Frigoribacterium sp. ME-P-080]